jgi:hypothetical protein
MLLGDPPLLTSGLIYAWRKMKLTICDLRDDCVSALELCFQRVTNVKVRKCDLTKVRADAWGTAGNSFGDMGGGVDRAIDQKFEGAAQKKVQQAIRSELYGELPVGTAVLVRPNPKLPALIYAPSMRVPGLLGPSINAYLATRTLLITAGPEQCGKPCLPGLRNRDRRAGARRCGRLNVPSVPSDRPGRMAPCPA